VKRLGLIVVATGLCLCGGSVASWTLASSGQAGITLDGKLLRKGSISQNKLSKGVQAKLDTPSVAPAIEPVRVPVQGAQGPRGDACLPTIEGCASTVAGPAGQSCSPCSAQNGSVGPPGATGSPGRSIQVISREAGNSSFCGGRGGVGVTDGITTPVDVCEPRDGHDGADSTVPGPPGQSIKGDPGRDGIDGSDGRDGHDAVDGKSYGCNGQVVLDPSNAPTCPGSPSGTFVTVTKTATLGINTQTVEATCPDVVVSGGFSANGGGFTIRANGPSDHSWRTTFDVEQAGLNVTITAICLEGT
jgi:hypothetical protein